MHELGVFTETFRTTCNAKDQKKVVWNISRDIIVLFWPCIFHATLCALRDSRSYNWTARVTNFLITAFVFASSASVETESDGKPDFVDESDVTVPESPIPDLPPRAPGVVVSE